MLLWVCGVQSNTWNHTFRCKWQSGFAYADDVRKWGIVIMSEKSTKKLSQAKIKALVMLIKSGKNTLDDIKDEDYRKAVETALKE